MKKKLILIFISLFVVIAIIEIFLRIFIPQELTSPFRVNGKDGSFLNMKNASAVHFFNERKITYKFGPFHNRAYDFEAKENKILVLGDSFTFGWLLNDKDTFIYKLNKKFSDYYFINAAAGGWGTSDQLKYLIEFCSSIKPKYTFLFINTDDLVRSNLSNLFYLNDDYKLVSGENKIYAIDKLTENFFYKIMVENLHLVNFLRYKISKIIYYKKFKDKILITKKKERDSKKDKDLIFMQKLFLEIKKEIKKCNTQVVFINLGWKSYDDYNLDDKGYININFLNEAKSFFKKNSFNFIDLNSDMKIIQSNKSKYIIKTDGHPNELTNQIIYDFLSKKIEKLIY